MILLKDERKTTRITICNYASYQTERNTNETQTKRTRTQTRMNKNDKKNDFKNGMLPFKDQYGKELLNEFFLYWTEPDAKGKMRYEKQSAFAFGRRLSTWSKNQSKYDTGSDGDLSNYLKNKTNKKMKLNIPDPNAKHSIEIIEGDNMKTMAGFKDKSIDLAIVDPPYGIGIDKAMNSNKGKQGFKQYKDTDWDNVAPDQEYFNELFRISKNQIIWGGNYFIDKIKTPTQCWLVWNKVQRDFTMSDGELAWTSFDKTIRMFDLSRGGAMGCNNRKRGQIAPMPKAGPTLCMDIKKLRPAGGCHF